MGGSLRRRLAAAALVLAIGCGEPAPPPPPPPPVVRLLPVPPQQIGPELTFQVEVSGCQRVATVRVFDRDLLLAEAPGAGPVTALTAPAARVDFERRGLSAQLSVLAEAVCDDGRSSRSGQSPITFLPAAEVHPGPWPFEAFAIESGGRTVLSCDRDLLRQDLQRNEKGRFAPELPCRAGDRISVGDGGAITLLQPGRAVTLLKPSLLDPLSIEQPGIREVLAPPTGLLHTTSFHDEFWFVLWAFDGNTSRWDTLVKRPAAPIFIDSRNRVVYPEVNPSDFAGYSELLLRRFDRGDGRDLGSLSLGRIQWEGSMPDAPLVAFSADGTTAYVADQERPSGTVRACDITGAQSCEEGAGLKWRSPRLDGGVTTVVRWAKGIIAVGPSVAWFLNASTGAVIGEALLPTSPVIFARAAAGADGSLYLLGRYPEESRFRELIVVDAPGQEAARLLVAGAGFAFEVDPSGRGWMLQDALVKLWSASEYAAAKR